MGIFGTGGGRSERERRTKEGKGGFWTQRTNEGKKRQENQDGHEREGKRHVRYLSKSENQTVNRSVAKESSDPLRPT